MRVDIRWKTTVSLGECQRFAKARPIYRCSRRVPVLDVGIVWMIRDLLLRLPEGRTMSYDAFSEGTGHKWRRTGAKSS